MILFFSNNVASRNYFLKLMSVLDAATLYKDSWFTPPSVHAFLMAPKDIIARQINYLDRQNQTLSGNPLSSFSRLILGFKARWFFARDWNYLTSHQPSLVVVWNGLMFRRSMFVAAAKALNIQCVFMENGLLPNTTVCDSNGINAVNSMPRDADFYNNLGTDVADKTIKLVARESKVTKKGSSKPLPEKFIFVPFQVDTDSQIIIFSDWITDMRHLFDELVQLSKEQPLYKLVFKEHPSSPIDYSHLHSILPDSIGMFANDYSTQELIEKSEAVITVNSTVGIEALLFGKKVIVLGRAFFNIPGLVISAKNHDELAAAWQGLPDFAFDDKLRKNFLHYLEEEYLVKGSWREADTEHCLRVKSRLMSIGR